MAETIEERVKDIEDLIADIPQLVTLRLEGVAAAQHETSARMGLLDKQMSMLLRDMRDLRGGVTRQLVEQDKRLASIESRVDAVATELSAVKSELSSGIAAVRSELGEGIAAVRSELGAGITAVRSELGEGIGSVKTGMSAIESKIDEMLRRLLNS